MSRAALWRQEGNVREREERAESLFESACAEGRRRGPSSVLPVWGDDATFSFNPVLLRQTVHSAYFQTCCENLRDWNSVVDEIYYKVTSLRVFSAAQQPSTAFCLLLRLLTLRMTPHQMDLTLKHVDSPYIRGIGFLYLRYSCPPDLMWKWIQPYVQDEEEFTIERAEMRGAKKITMGDFVRSLFQRRDFHGETPLPRLPFENERELSVQLLEQDKIADRAAQHFKNSSRMGHFKNLGSVVMALYGDEANPVTWYKAVVDRVIVRDELGPLKYPRFVVTFCDYGNTETVTLGEMDTVEGEFSSANNISRNRNELEKEVRRRERDQVARGPRDRRYTGRGNKSSFQGGFARSYHEADRSQGVGNTQKSTCVQGRNSSAPPKSDNDHARAHKRSAQELALIADKKRKLMTKYG